VSFLSHYQFVAYIYYTAKGDCGSWVLDDNGILYGQIVAARPQTRISYVLLARDIFRDIQNQFGGRPVRLPRETDFVTEAIASIKHELREFNVVPTTTASPTNPGPLLSSPVPFVSPTTFPTMSEEYSMTDLEPTRSPRDFPSRLGFISRRATTNRDIEASAADSSQCKSTYFLHDVIVSGLS